MASVVGNTLAQIVTAVAQEVGPCEQIVTSSTPGAANLVVVASMVDSEAKPDKYGGSYLYNIADTAPNSLLGQQGRVTKGGFAGGSGTFTVAAGFTANPHDGATWLLLGTIPVLDQDGLIGLRTCVNRALRKLWIIDKIDIAATSGTVVYDLAAYWWMSKDRVKRLLDPDPGGSGHQVPSSQGWQVVQDGDVWVLELGSGYPTGQTFSLLVERPLNSRLYLGGVWADQASPTAGLVLGSDACLGQFEHVKQATLYEAMKQLAIQAGGARKDFWRQRAQEQGMVVSAIKTYQMESIETSLGEGQSDSPSAWSGLGDKGLFSRGWY